MKLKPFFIIVYETNLVVGVEVGANYPSFLSGNLFVTPEYIEVEKLQKVQRVLAYSTRSMQ